MNEGSIGPPLRGGPASTRRGGASVYSFWRWIRTRMSDETSGEAVSGVWRRGGACARLPRTGRGSGRGAWAEGSRGGNGWLFRGAGRKRGGPGGAPGGGEPLPHARLLGRDHLAQGAAAARALHPGDDAGRT